MKKQSLVAHHIVVCLFLGFGLLTALSFVADADKILPIKPTATISISPAKEHYFHVSNDGFAAIDLLSKNDFVVSDLTTKSQTQFRLKVPLAFNFRVHAATQNNIATVEGDKVVKENSQMYLYSFYDLVKNVSLFDFLSISKQEGGNYLGRLVGTKYKKVNGEDRFLVIIEFKNVFDNSIVYKGWLFKKEGLIPPIISFESEGAIFELSRAGLTELKDFDCTGDGKKAILAFNKSNWVYNADTKTWNHLGFKDEVGSIVFFTPAGFLFTLVNTYSGDDCIIWDPSTLKKLKGVDLNWSHERIRFSANGALVAVWNGKNNISIWDLNSKSLIALLDIPTVSDRSIQREPIPHNFAVNDGPQAMDASPDLKTIVVYSTVANNIKYNEASKEGTYDITHQLLDVFRISAELNIKDELNLKLKN